MSSLSNQSIYAVRIYNPSGTLVADLTGLELTKDITKTRNDNDIIKCTFSLDKLRAYAKSMELSIISILASNLNEIRISKRGTVISAGQIQTVERNVDGSTRTVTVTAIGWFGLLARYYTDTALSYTATDAGTIATGLLTNAQAQPNGTLGITTGTVQTSNNLTVAYDQYKRVKDAIVELSAMYGSFDFEVTWDKVFNIYFPGIGSKRDDIPLLFPGNVKKIRVTDDGTVLANRIIAQGSGLGGDKYLSIKEDATSETVYGLRTNTITYNDIFNQTMLDNRATADVAAVSRYISIPEVTLDGALGPDVTKVHIGDQLKFIIDPKEDGFQDLNNNYFRVESFTWSVDANNVEELHLVLAS